MAEKGVKFPRVTVPPPDTRVLTEMLLNVTPSTLHPVPSSATYEATEPVTHAALHAGDASGIAINAAATPRSDLAFSIVASPLTCRRPPPQGFPWRPCRQPIGFMPRRIANPR